MRSQAAQAAVLLALLTAVLAPQQAAAAAADAWRERVIYELLVDRWADGSVRPGCRAQHALSLRVLHGAAPEIAHRAQAHVWGPRRRTHGHAAAGGRAQMCFQPAKHAPLQNAANPDTRFNMPDATAGAAPCPDVRQWCGGARRGPPGCRRAPRLAGQRGGLRPLFWSPELTLYRPLCAESLCLPTSRSPLPSPPCTSLGTLAAAADRLAYISDLGAGAIWVSPVVKQCPGVMFGSAGYHGYWAQGGAAAKRGWWLGAAWVHS